MFCLAATPCVQAHGQLRHEHDLHVLLGTLVDAISFSDTLHKFKPSKKCNTGSACLYVYTCSPH